MVEANSTVSHEIYGPNPYTERSYSSVLAVSKNNKFLAYAVGNVIVIRSLEDLNKIRIFTAHSVKTSAVSFSPSGVFVASGDTQGNVKIWFLDDLSIKKEYNSLIGEKIYGIGWTEDSSRLLVHGIGKSVSARVIMWDSGNNVGEISGHTGVILGGDIRQQRPYRLVTSGEDFNVNFYDGPPFRLKRFHKIHTNFASAVKFSPNGNWFISVGSDKKVVLYDFKEGNPTVIADDKTENNHKSAIVSVYWINDKEFATCALDKLVKVWDLETRTVIKTLKIAEKPEIDDIQCAVAANNEYLISLSLNGALNFWNLNSLQDEAFPNKVIQGHQNYICSIVFGNENNLLFSSDNNGKILSWDSNKTPSLVHHIHRTKIVKLALSKDNKVLFSYAFDLTLVAFDLVENKVLYQVKINKGEPQSIQESRDGSYHVYVLNHNGLYLVHDGKVVEEHEFEFHARAFAVTSGKKHFIGDKNGNYLVFDENFKQINKKSVHDSEITCMRLSNNEKHLASGDNTKYIKIVDSETLDLYTDNFQYHNSKIFDIVWSSNDEKLASGSLDRNLITWDLIKKSKINIYSDLDYEVIKTLAFGGDSDVYSGGHSCSLFKIKI